MDWHCLLKTSGNAPDDYKKKAKAWSALTGQKVGVRDVRKIYESGNAYALLAPILIHRLSGQEGGGWSDWLLTCGKNGKDCGVSQPQPIEPTRDVNEQDLKQTYLRLWDRWNRDMQQRFDTLKEFEAYLEYTPEAIISQVNVSKPGQVRNAHDLAAEVNDFFLYPLIPKKLNKMDEFKKHVDVDAFVVQYVRVGRLQVLLKNRVKEIIIKQLQETWNDDQKKKINTYAKDLIILSNALESFKTYMSTSMKYYGFTPVEQLAKAKQLLENGAIKATTPDDKDDSPANEVPSSGGNVLRRVRAKRTKIIKSTGTW